jgi:pyruvate ferredoxin oxidoreductase gamma subunit
MFRIRFHGRGGQGIKTSSRILGSAFFREGYEVQDAPVYGAERRGAPMFAYVRAARQPIQERGVITRPDLVIVADETLVPLPAANVLFGVTADTALLINSGVAGETWRARLNLAGPVVTLPVGPGVVTPAQAHVGATCAGAAARLVGVIGWAALGAAIEDELAEHGAAVVRANREQALAAFEAAAPHAGVVKEGGVIEVRDYARPRWIDLPFELARVAAPDIYAPATSVQTKTGAWRTVRPVIDRALCRRCSWVCSTMCPESAIRVMADGAPEIDYEHCKGCLVCVTVCPPHAIRAVAESEFAEERT